MLDRNTASALSLDTALVTTGALFFGIEIVRVAVLVATGRDDSGLVSIANTLITVFVGIITAGRVGTIVATVRNRKEGTDATNKDDAGT